MIKAQLLILGRVKAFSVKGIYVPIVKVHELFECIINPI